MDQEVLRRDAIDCICVREGTCLCGIMYAEIHEKMDGATIPLTFGECEVTKKLMVQMHRAIDDKVWASNIKNVIDAVDS